MAYHKYILNNNALIIVKYGVDPNQYLPTGFVVMDGPKKSDSPKSIHKDEVDKKGYSLIIPKVDISE
ncbi:hypothetical protein [Aeromonas hydrophila]|uniref:hypothetical protein n=1 Tax=Aeromonas hydrophila TaxID=644 RepID=UPI0023626E26|nr:hypothetical protein [Aeromonas hydrophila]